MSHTSKQLLFAKIGFLCKNKNKRDYGEKLEKRPEFIALLKDIGDNFDGRDYTPVGRQQVVMALVHMNIKDPVILGKTADMLKAKRFKNLNQITNLLYAFAKLGYKHTDDQWLSASVDSLVTEPAIDRYLACRNLWNLQALGFRSDAALKKFSDIIAANDANEMSEVDISNALSSLAYFQYVHYDSIVKLIE